LRDLTADGEADQPGGGGDPVGVVDDGLRIVVGRGAGDHGDPGAEAQRLAARAADRAAVSLLLAAPPYSRLMVRRFVSWRNLSTQSGNGNKIEFLGGPAAPSRGAASFSLVVPAPDCGAHLSCAGRRGQPVGPGLGAYGETGQEARCFPPTSVSWGALLPPRLGAPFHLQSGASVTLPASSHVWLNGELLPSKGPHISAYDRGFQLGDAVFEALRAKRGVAIELDGHLARLHGSLKALAFELPFDDEAVATGIKQLLAAEGWDGAEPAGDAVIRITVSRGYDPTRGVAPRERVGGRVELGHLVEVAVAQPLAQVRAEEPVLDPGAADEPDDDDDAGREQAEVRAARRQGLRGRDRAERRGGDHQRQRP